MKQKEYVIPELEDFRIGFEYEKFETVLKDEYKNKDGRIIIPGFKIYSDKYFEELHSNDKYWKHRKWVKKKINNLYDIPYSKTYKKEGYAPLGIENIYRVSKESLLKQAEEYLENVKERIK